jgi:hypothetical protein
MSVDPQHVAPGRTYLKAEDIHLRYTSVCDPVALLGTRRDYVL